MGVWGIPSVGSHILPICVNDSLSPHLLPNLKFVIMSGCKTQS
jgi:hypothetical protein